MFGWHTKQSYISINSDAIIIFFLLRLFDYQGWWLGCKLTWFTCAYYIASFCLSFVIFMAYIFPVVVIYISPVFLPVCIGVSQKYSDRYFFDSSLIIIWYLNYIFKPSCKESLEIEWYCYPHYIWELYYYDYRILGGFLGDVVTNRCKVW